MTDVIRRKSLWARRAGCLLALVAAGCSGRSERDVYSNPYGVPTRLAVAPFRNLSGSSDLDVVAATDEFYSELQAVEGLEVVPVNRVLATLADLGWDNVQKPEDVLVLADALAVEGVIVGSITRYDPYPPPQVGMVLQLYLRTQRDSDQAVTYVNPGESFELSRARMIQPAASVVRIFDAREEEVAKRGKQFAKHRGASDSPYSWKKYTTQRNYLKFVSYEMIGELLAGERQRLQKK